MQVRPDQLESYLARSRAGTHLVCGDEPLQVQEATDAIRRSCREDGFMEREIIDVDKDFDWQNLIDEASSMSLFSDRRLLDVRMPSGKPGREGSKVIKELVSELPEDINLLFTTGKLDKSSKSSAWFKAIEANGTVVQCWPVDRERLPAWIAQRFQSRGMQADREVADFIAEHVEGNLLAADQEIEKLLLILGPGTVGIDATRESITQNSRYNLFEMVDLALGGELARVIRMIQGLKTEGAEPILINWALSKELRILLRAAREPRQAEHILRSSGVWQNRLPVMKAFLRRHDQQKIKSLIQRCVRVDRVNKGMETADAWLEIEDLCVSIAS